MGKRAVLLLIAVLAASNLLMAGSVFAESAPEYSVPEFTLEYVDTSYDVPPKTTSTTDPYTNETTTTTIQGYHVEAKAVQATINNTLGASYYNFRYKGTYEDKWKYYPFNTASNTDYNEYAPSNILSDFAASTSDYTVIQLTFLPDIPEDGMVDVQVQALFGGYRKYPSQMIGGMLYGGDPYDYHFNGTTSNWSTTQTITNEKIPTSPEPQQMEQEVIVGLAITAAVLAVGLSLLIYLTKRK